MNYTIQMKFIQCNGKLYNTNENDTMQMENLKNTNEIINLYNENEN